MVDPKSQLQNIVNYISDKEKYAHLAPTILFDLIAVRIFRDTLLADPECMENMKKVDFFQFDFNSEEFCDMTVFFKTEEHSSQFIEKKCNRNLLGYHSNYFHRELRPGGKLSNPATIPTITNVHATQKAVDAVFDIFNGNEDALDSLDYIDKEDARELIKFLKMPYAKKN